MIAEADNNDMLEEEAEMEEEGDARLENAYALMPNNNEQENDAVLGVDDDAEDEDADVLMDEDSDDDSEDADSSASDGEESAASDEYHWGDHVSSRNAFVYNGDDSDDSEASDSADDEAAEQTEQRRRSAMVRARRSILHFLRSNQDQNGT